MKKALLITMLCAASSGVFAAMGVECQIAEKFISSHPKLASIGPEGQKIIAELKIAVQKGDNKECKMLFKKLGHFAGHGSAAIMPDPPAKQ